MKQLVSLLSMVLVAGQVSAGDFAVRGFQGSERSPRFVMYVQKPVGAAHRDGGMRLGFGVERQAPQSVLRGSAPLRATAHRFLDVKVAPFGRGAAEINGMRLSGGPGARGFDGEGSLGGGDSWTNWWWWVLGGAALGLGISCATDNWPCSDGDGDDYTPPTGE